MQSYNPATTYTLRSLNNWLSFTTKFGFENSRYQIADKLRVVYDVNILQDRVLALEDLIVHCDVVINQLNNELKNEAKLKLIQSIRDLQEEALLILKSILDVKSNTELQIKLNENRKYLITNEDVKGQKFKGVISQNFFKKANNEKLRDMDEKYEGETAEGVVYLSKLQREEKRVILSDGCFKHIVRTQESNPYDQSLSVQPFETAGLKSKFEPDCAIIVVDKRGNIFAGTTTSKSFHHSSLIAGKPAYFAGCFKTNEKGELKEIRNQSGHYKPTKKNTINFLVHLAKKGALDSCVQISLFKDPLQKSKIKHKIDVNQIQHKLLNKKIKSELMSYNEWRIASAEGLFYTRYVTLTNIDKLLLLYFKKFNILSPNENIELIDEIIKEINKQQQSYPNSSRKDVVLALKEQLIDQRKQWESRIIICSESNLMYSPT